MSKSCKKKLPLKRNTKNCQFLQKKNAFGNFYEKMNNFDFFKKLYFLGNILTFKCQFPEGQDARWGDQVRQWGLLPGV